MPSTLATSCSQSIVRPVILGAADPGVDEEEDDRGVAAVVEPRTRAGIEELLEILVAVHGRRRLCDCRRPHPRHRRLADLALVDEPAEELLETAVAVRRARRLQPRELVLDEGFDVLPLKCADGSWHAALSEEGVQAGGAVEMFWPSKSM